MNLAIAHRDRLTREALRRTFLRSRYTVSWTASDPAMLAQRLDDDPPSLLLAELALLGPRAAAVQPLLAKGCSVIALAPAGAISDAYEALTHGALGLVEPPSLQSDGTLVGAARVLAQMERLSKAIRHARAPAPPAAAPVPSDPLSVPPLLALGASTGGPHALATILSSLPCDFRGAVVLVQHIESEFTGGLAQWLAGQCRLPVELAERGTQPRAGRVYVAPPGGHLALLPNQQFTQSPATGSELHVPSVDALFLSLARHAAPGVAALLTGMGHDGVAGLAELRRRGWYTVAQDEDSSIVYGMPRVAVELGAVDHSLALSAIGPALVRQLSLRSAR